MKNKFHEGICAEGMSKNMIRPMQASDVPRVTEIHVFGWRCAYRGIVSDEHLFTKMLVSTRLEKTAAWLDTDGNADVSLGETYVYDDGIVKGFLTIGQCRDEDKAGVFELGGLYVDPCFKSQGIGRALALYCEEIAVKKGFNEILLWTFEKNAPTRAFYEKLGYTLDGKTMVVEPLGATGVRYSKRI